MKVFSIPERVSQGKRKASVGGVLCCGRTGSTLWHILG